MSGIFCCSDSNYDCVTYCGIALETNALGHMHCRLICDANYVHCDLRLQVMLFCSLMSFSSDMIRFCFDSCMQSEWLSWEYVFHHKIAILGEAGTAPSIS